MSESARVLLLIDDAGVGGGQKHVLQLAERLDRDRFAPVVACAGEGFLVDELRRRGVPVHPLALSNRPNPGAVAACVRLVRRTRPAILHTHGGTAGAIGRVAAVLAGVGARRVHTHHGIHYLHDGSALRRFVLRGVDRALLRWTDHTICVAESDLALGLRHGVVDAAAASVIPNGVDLHALAAAGRAPGAAAGRPIVGTIGRLHPQKGQSDLVAAAERVLRRRPDALFRIVGDGELRPALAAQIRRAGLDTRIELLGERSDVPALLAQMTVFALPSLWEGLPLALLEAMAAGVPCVATRVDGVGEVLEDRTDGLLVPPSDPERLADAILEILASPDLAASLARRALAKVRSRFDLETMVRRTEAVYEAVLRRPGPEAPDPRAGTG